MPLNVLLMLGLKQAPAPKVEMNHHTDAWARDKSPVSLATTPRPQRPRLWRKCSGVLRGQRNGQRVSRRRPFRGLPAGYVRSRAAELLQSHGLYSTNGVPHGLRGFVILSHIRKPKRGETLTSLSGRPRTGGKELSLKNIPAGPGARPCTSGPSALFGE